MTASFIAFHAAERPDAVALVENGRSISFAEFSRDIGKFTQALREFALPPGGKVAIGCDNLYAHWLLRLACEELHLVSASVIAQESLSALPFLEEFDLVFLNRPINTPRIRRRKPVTSDWLETVFERADSGPRSYVLKRGPEDPLRILHTSVTTRQPEAVGVPAARP